MEKPIRKAVRCFLIKDGKVVVIKYKTGTKVNYYDIPGGKIEDGEEIEQTAIREFFEETGMNITNPKLKGIMYVEYPDRKFLFNVFTVNEYEGHPENFDENISKWIDIKELLNQEKILSNIIILNNIFLKQLKSEDNKFEMHIEVDNEENILGLKYEIIS